jgi:hypothetical protein
MIGRPTIKEAKKINDLEIYEIDHLTAQDKEMREEIHRANNRLANVIPVTNPEAPEHDDQAMAGAVLYRAAQAESILTAILAKYPEV